MSKDNLLFSLKKLASTLENEGYYDDAVTVDNVLSKVAEDNKLVYEKELLSLINEEGGINNIIDALEQINPGEKVALDMKKLMRIVTLAAMLLGVSTQTVMAQPSLLKQFTGNIGHQIQNQIGNKINQEISGAFNPQYQSVYDKAAKALTPALLQTVMQSYTNKDIVEGLLNGKENLTQPEIRSK